MLARPRSASSRATRRPLWLSATPRLMATLVLPTPPLPPLTAITCTVSLAISRPLSNIHCSATPLALVLTAWSPWSWPGPAVARPAAAAAPGRWQRPPGSGHWPARSEEHTSELQSRGHLVCRLLLEKKNKIRPQDAHPYTDHII